MKGREKGDRSPEDGLEGVELCEEETEGTSK